jgi:AcrR family transcriptional regulator
MAKRDPEATRHRLLDAAFEEFVMHGLAGARVAAIVKRARVNPRMLYHYFGSKEGLFEALLAEKLRGATDDRRASARFSLADALEFWQRNQAADASWTRLLLWEALEDANRPVANFDERKAGWARIVEHLGASQERGELPADLDPAQLELSFVALVTFPVAFPQYVRLITGLEPNSPEFLERRVRFLRALAGYLESGVGPHAATSSSRPAGPAP